MKRILRSRLPERLAGNLPTVLVEFAVGLAITLLMVVARAALVPWTGDTAPYALVFVSVAAAAVVGGWRSGLVALLVGQSLAWILIVEPAWSLSGAQPDQIAGLLLATFAELMALVIIALYQREVDLAWSKREKQLDLLNHALAEIDHRTVNNYQTVLSLILAQARRADPPVKAALLQVADRISAIALASKQLALRSNSLDDVRVTHHLGELCAQIRKGFSRPGVSMEYQFEDVRLGAEQAIAMSILVNELVTNALKHAFPDGRSGQIRVSLGKSGRNLLLEVVDDGVGIGGGSNRTSGTGIGTRLVATFTKQLKARHDVDTSADGTRHRILIPLA